MKNIKILISTVLILALCLACFPGFADENITVKVNGVELKTDVTPYTLDGRTLVPVRAIFESLGATVHWDEDTQSVIGGLGNTIIILQINNNNAFVNNQVIPLDVPAQLFNDRTMVPARFVAESLGATVLWDEATSTVDITK